MIRDLEVSNENLDMIHAKAIFYVFNWASPRIQGQLKRQVSS